MQSADQYRDEGVARYLAAALPLFEMVRGVACQLAGFVLLHAAAPRSTSVEDAPLADVEERLAEAIDGIRSLAAPAEGAHHHHHLLLAAQGLRLALEGGRHHLPAGRLAGLSGAAVVAPLSEAVAHLRHASAALPGFHLVDLQQSCCAGHAPR